MLLLMFINGRCLFLLHLCKIDVVVAGLHGKESIKCSRMVVIQPDTNLDEVANNVFDAVILPGGLKGAEALAQSSVVGDILKRHESGNSVLAAICAGKLHA